MIVFETQQDFEDAVVRIIKERLEVRVSTRASWSGNPVTKVKLIADGETFAEDEE